MEIQVKTNLLSDSNQSALHLAEVTHLTYPTVHKLVHGKWNRTGFAVLAKFLDGLGFTTAELQECKFSDIFSVKD